MHSDQFNKRCVRSPYWKPWHILREFNENDTMFNRLDDSVLLACEFSPHWSIDLTRFQLYFQQIFFCRNWKTESKMYIEMERA